LTLKNHVGAGRVVGFLAVHPFIEE